MNLFLLTVLVLLASFLGTTTGFGLSTIMVPALSLFFTLPETLLFVGIIHWFGDIWKMIFFKKGIAWRLIFFFGLPGILISYLAGFLPNIIDVITFTRFLGLFLLAYVIFILLHPRWRLPSTVSNLVSGGLLSGFSASLFGQGGAIRSAFLTAFNLPKTIYLFTSGAIGILIDTARLTAYFQSGIRLQTFSYSSLLLAIPASFLGAFLAQKLVHRLPQKLFRPLIAIFLFLVALKLLSSSYNP